MAHKTPQVEGSFLVDPAALTPPIAVGSPDWYRWLAAAGSFAVVGVGGRYTARKDRRDTSDGYWRAYRKSQGKLASVYLGRSGDLSLEHLRRAGTKLGLVIAANEDRPVFIDSAEAARVLTFLLIGDDEVLLTPDVSAKPASGSPPWIRAVADALETARGEIFTPAPAMRGVVLSDVLDALKAAISVQRRLFTAVQAGQLAHVPAMALHTGVSTRQQGVYVGQPVDWSLQLLASAHPGQLLLSQVTHALIATQLPADVSASNLGTFRMGASRQQEQIFQLIVNDVPAARQAPRYPACRPGHLPASATPLIGRARALAELSSSLLEDTTRLITLTGPGGVGKTRLALEVGLKLNDHFADGVFFVDMAAITAPALIRSTIAETLELSAQVGQSVEAQLSVFLAPRQILLILDNFEQLIGASVALAQLLAVAPNLKLLVTSRAPLHLLSEHEFPIAPLEMPAGNDLANLDILARTEAIAVFIQRAQAVNPSFSLTRETAPAIVEICRRLDGLPLAIELAATRCKVFSPTLLLQRLDHRLALLTGGAGDLPARQRTLRDTIDWSYQLLDRAAQALLQRLAVFAGGATLEAIEALWQGSDRHFSASEGSLALEVDILQVLERLIDQSLLRSATDGGGVLRFALLETIREYALEHLEQSGEAECARRQHARYFVHVAEQTSQALQGPRTPSSLDRLASEQANIRTALEWLSTHGEGDLAARLASAMLIFWDMRPHREEGRAWLERILGAGSPLTPDIRARALFAAGYLSRSLKDRDRALRLLEESEASFQALGDECAELAALTERALTIAMLGGDLEQATALLQNSLLRYRLVDDQRGIAWALQALGWIEQRRVLGYPSEMLLPLSTQSWVVRKRGSLATARAMHEESLALRRSSADITAITWSLLSLALVVAAEGEYEAAQAYQEERLEIERSLNNHHGISSALYHLGMVALRRGQLTVARSYIEESLALARGIGDPTYARFALMGLGELALAEEDASRATTLLTEALSLGGDQHRRARVYALLAQAALERGDDAAVPALIAQTIQTARALNAPALLSAGLAYLGDGAARRGEAAWAALLWGAAEHQGQAHPRVRAEPYGYQQLFARVRAVLGARAFAAIWAKGLGLESEAALNARERMRAVPTAGYAARSTPLTPREAEVLALLAEGLSNAEIAERMVITLATVKAHLSSIYSKIGVRSRTAAMRYASSH